MSKWHFLGLLLVLLSVPFSAHAQEQVTFEQVDVQLWPEYDTPEMLAILNILLSSETTLPAQITVQIPGDVEKPYVVAVGPSAQAVTDQGIDYSFENNGDILEITVTATQPAIRIEYYDSLLVRTGDQRSYVYSWITNHAVNSFRASILVPVDTTEIATDPAMSQSTQPGTTQSYLSWGTNDLQVGQNLPIEITYTKTSDRLTVGNQPLETGPIDENTSGRVSLSNYLPYILGGLGILLIAAGGIYFWQTSRGKSQPRKRHPSKSPEDGEAIYCQQCGKRAQSSDRFCRTCGTRLRRE